MLGTICSFGWRRIANVFLVIVTREVSITTWASFVQNILDSAFRLVPDLSEIVASEEHQEGANEFVGFFLPLLNEVAFDIVDDFLAFVFHLVDLVLQPELLLAEERHVELLGGVSTLQVPPNIQVVVSDDARDDR